ncbi:PEGA domain-containing protein [bacterium]|nr:PEGA domain-containing protein [bacterium]
MPQLFSRRKKDEGKSKRVTTFKEEQRQQVAEVVEAGLFPVRVASRNGVKLFNFSLKIALLAVIGVAVASYLGFIDPIRKIFQPIQTGTGTLIVSTDYIRAQVLLDGKILGQTPFTGENISAGKHILKVQAAENTNNFFESSEVGIIINPGNATIVKANLAPDQSLFSYTIISSMNRREGDPLLVIKALPQEVRATVDGNEVGSIPYVSESISTGPHQVHLDKEGYKPVLVDITIAEDKVVTIESRLYHYQVMLER